MLRGWLRLRGESDWIDVCGSIYSYRYLDSETGLGYRYTGILYWRVLFNVIQFHYYLLSSVKTDS